MNTQTITLSNSQTIRVSIKPGAPNSVPLLIMNGIGANLSLLSPFVEAMHEANPDLEIITFDSPGVGGSSTPSLPYRFSGLAKTIAQMLDYLDYGKVDVLGLSWGGFLGQQFAHDYPHRCNKLILAATCAGVVAIPPSLKVLSVMSSPKRYTDSDFMAHVAPEIYGGAFKTNPALAAEYAQKMVKSKGEYKTCDRGYKYQQAAICWWSSLWFLHIIKQPTLLLRGDDDPLINPINMQVMNSLMPNASLYTVINGGHLFLLTHLDVVVPTIVEFLNEQTR